MSKIYDILYNDVQCYVIICSDIHREIIDIIVNDNSISFTKIICKHKHVTVYTTQPTDFYSTISLSLSSKQMCISPVSRYPSFPNEIIMTTCVRNEDNIIRQWISYHQLLGVSRFIIYDNSKSPHNKAYLSNNQLTSDLETVLHDEIKNGIVILINWSYHYKFQQTQLNHCLYTFRKSKFIGFMDVDEYVNIQHVDKIHQLETYSNHIGFMLRNKEFHNPLQLSEKHFDFLRITNCNQFSTMYHNKLFIKPINNIILSVHTVTTGDKPYTISTNDVYFNHYIFLNKEQRGRTEVPYKDDSILRLATSLL